MKLAPGAEEGWRGPARCWRVLRSAGAFSVFKTVLEGKNVEFLHLMIRKYNPTSLRRA